jgi:membrane protease subunit HflC
LNRHALKIAAVVIAVVAAVLIYSAAFRVDQTQQAVVLQFGDPVQVISEPGLHWKLPFLQEVRYVEKRVLNLDPPRLRIVLRGQLRLEVNSFVRYRIVDPLKFITVAVNEETLNASLGSIVNDAVRSVLGQVTLSDVLSPRRAELMAEIRQRVNEEAEDEGFGIVIVDLRIGRADLAADVSESVYQRMRAERERDAAEFRAQGQEQFQTITAGADREATVIRAEASREADIIRGVGDAERTRILNEAYGRDPDFFLFYRTMQAYRQSLDPAHSFMVLTTSSDFFQYFQSLDRPVPAE